MREALYLVYAASMVLAASAVTRVRPLQVPTHHGVSPALIGYIYLSVLLFGGGIGYLVPRWIAESLSFSGNPSALRPHIDVGVLGRLVQLIGAACGAWIALRGLWLWTVLCLVGLAIYAGLRAIAWIGAGAW